MHQNIARCISILFITLSLTASGAAAYLMCSCDICDDRVCQTDGYCLTSAAKYSGDEKFSYYHGCIDRRDDDPPGKPLRCQQRGDNYATNCCNNTHFCNRYWKPRMQAFSAGVKPVAISEQEKESSLSFNKVFVQVKNILSWITAVRN